MTEEEITARVEALAKLMAREMGVLMREACGGEVEMGVAAIIREHGTRTRVYEESLNEEEVETMRAVYGDPVDVEVVELHRAWIIQDPREREP